MKRFIIPFLLALLAFQAIAQDNLDSFPYELSKAEYLWLGAGIATWGSGYYLSEQTKPLSIEAIDALNADQINGFDRPPTSKWNTQLDDISHVGKYVLAFSPAILLIPPFKQKKWKSFFTYGVMYFETTLLTTGLTELTKGISQRTRPFYYNSQFTSTEKQQLGIDYGQSNSFVSGHSAISFSSAVFLSITYQEIYGKNIWSKIIWGSSLALATGTSYLRYESGQHFPTDIIVGAALGASIGWLIPYTHKSKNTNLGLMIAPNHFYMTYRF